MSPTAKVNEETCMWKVDDQQGNYRGMVLKIVNIRAQSESEKYVYIEAADPRRYHETLEAAVQAVQDSDLLNPKASMILARNPIQPEIILPKGRMEYVASQVNGEQQLYVCVIREGEEERWFPKKDGFGYVFELPNGVWVNEYRPVLFKTKEEAASDLLRVAGPEQFRFIRGGNEA